MINILAGDSAAVSAVAFLLPALLITSPFRRPYEMSEWLFWRLLTFVLFFCAATAAIAAIYNFQIVSIANIYAVRTQLQFPTILNYAIGAATSVLLPFAFACFVVRNKFWLAALVLLIAVSFYPSPLTKVALFTPVWLASLALISRFFEPRATTFLIAPSDPHWHSSHRDSGRTGAPLLRHCQSKDDHRPLQRDGYLQ